MARILLVEDSRTQAYAITRILERNGHKVIVAGNGHDGISYAKTHIPDLVIMDVVMPGASGFHATRSIAKDRETESIPVIMLTSKDQVADKLWAFRQGAMGYLVKPVAERELMDTVDNLLEITTLADTREAC